MIQQPIIRPLDSGHYELVKPYRYTCNNGTMIFIDKGYITNGADIPRFFWRLYPPFSPEYLPAVIVHDYLCDVADSDTDKTGRFVKFHFADNVFREMLTKLGVSKVKVTMFYNAVRLHHKFNG